MPEVVVASWNVHAGVDGWGRRFDVVDACRSLHADVVVLQEEWAGEGRPSTAAAVAEELGYSLTELPFACGSLLGPPAGANEGWGPAFRSLDVAPSLRLDGDKSIRGRWSRVSGRPAERGWWGVALLSSVPVVRSWTVELGKLSRDPARRAALFSELRVGDRPLVVGGTHLSHLTHGSLLQLTRLRRLLSSARASVLAGDMNLWGPPVSALLPGWRRAVRSRTWPAQRPLAQLDHIMVAAHVSVVSGEVLEPGGSDHLAVRARLALGRT